MNSLLPIREFITEAKAQGVTFGLGDPKIHLAYLTKIGILPQSVKRKIAGEITGCYAQEEIQTLLKVEEMKKNGMTYSQIAKLLQGYIVKDPTSLETQNPVKNNLTIEQFNNGLSRSTITSLSRSYAFLYLVIGILVGFLLSTLNSQGLEAMRNQATLATNQSQQPTAKVSYGSGQNPDQSVYIISIPKQNLDTLPKTNINTLIAN